MKTLKLLSQFLIILGCILVVAYFSVIKNSSKASKVNKNNEDIIKTIEFQHYFSGSMSGGIDQMVRKLNSENTSYMVKAVPIDHESYKIRIMDSLNGKSSADLYSYWAGAKTKALADKFENIQDIWVKEKLDKIFPKAIVDSACKYDGKMLLVPITQHYVGVVYNKKIFDSLGIKIPKTWQEFIKVCDMIKEKKKIPIALGSKSKWPAQFWFDYILLRTAPIEFRNALMEGKASYTDLKVENTLRLWKSLIDKGYFNKNCNEIEWDSGAAEMLYKGEAAMTLMGTWIIGYYGDDKHKWELGKNYDFFEFPIIDKNIKGCSLGPIDGIVVASNSINKKEAK